MSDKLYDDTRKYNPTHKWTHEDIGDKGIHIYWDFFHKFDKSYGYTSKELSEKYTDDYARFDIYKANYNRLLILVSVHIGNKQKEYITSIDPSMPYTVEVADGITISKYDDPNLNLYVKNTNNYESMGVTVLNIESYNPINVYKVVKSDW